MNRRPNDGSLLSKPTERVCRSKATGPMRGASAYFAIGTDTISHFKRVVALRTARPCVELREGIFRAWRTLCILRVSDVIGVILVSTAHTVLAGNARTHTFEATILSETTIWRILSGTTGIDLTPQVRVIFI